MKNTAKVAIFLARRQFLRGNRWMIFLTLVLIAVAFINLIFITALFNGVIEKSNNQVIDALYGHISIAPPNGDKYFSNRDQVISDLQKIDRVKSVSFQNVVPASMQYKDVEGSWSVLAIDPSKERQVTDVADNMISGFYLDPSDTDQIVLGRQTAGGPGVESNSSSLKGAKVGDVVVLTVNGTSKNFTVKGIYSTKYMLADRVSFISEKAWEVMAPDYAKKANSFTVRLDHKGDEADVISKMQEAGIPGNYSTWEDNAGLMKSVIDSFTTIKGVMTTLGILVAAATIFIIVYIDILNKRRQIGTLRAIGINRRVIVIDYLLQTLAFALLGTVLGCAVFLMIVLPIFRAHPFVLPIGDVVPLTNSTDILRRFFLIVVAATLSGLVPSLAAVKSSILDELRGK